MARGIFVTHMCRRRQDVAFSRDGDDFHSPQGKLGSVVLQQETISLFMETGLHKQDLTRLTLNSWPFRPSFPSARITGMWHHTQLNFLLIYFNSFLTIYTNSWNWVPLRNTYKCECLILLLCPGSHVRWQWPKWDAAPIKEELQQLVRKRGRMLSAFERAAFSLKRVPCKNPEGTPT